MAEREPLLRRALCTFDAQPLCRAYPDLEEACTMSASASSDVGLVYEFPQAALAAFSRSVAVCLHSLDGSQAGMEEARPASPLHLGGRDYPHRQEAEESDGEMV